MTGEQAMIDTTPTRVQTTLEPGLRRLGTLVPKSAGEISTSRWTLGCETLDREYASYETYKEYIVPLGIGRIRLQGGWARTEKDPGIYDFAWLDRIIDDARSRGLSIWLETSYGNPAYPGGGGRTLAGGFPTSPQALAAWDAWVEKTALRYKGKVRDWSMWNEPDGRAAHTAEAITEFNIRTAQIIKRIIPDARIAGLVLCRPKVQIIECFLRTLAERGKLGLFEWVVYHGYPANPDDMYPEVIEARKVVQRYSPTIRLWQGESGVQSEWCPAGALGKMPWTELKQAKWDARRQLGDLSHDVDSEVFTIADLDYRTTSFHNGLLRYGLLKTAGAAEGFKILKVKPAYYAIQNIVSIFNDAVTVDSGASCDAACGKPVAAFVHRFVEDGRPLLVFWDKSGVPGDSNETVPATFRLRAAAFKSPVWVDTLTGGVYELPADRLTSERGAVTLRDIPVYDAPAFIADGDALTFAPVAGGG